MSVTDAPDWQEVVVTVASGGVAQDAPDWQKVVVSVSSTGMKQDFPDWQHTIVGPGGTPAPIPPAPPDTYNGLIKYYNPLWWYKLDDAAGSATVVDSGSLDLAGTVNGGVTLGVTGPMSQTAAEFDGSTGLIETGGNLPLLPGPLTVIIWFNTTSAIGGDEVMFSTFVDGDQQTMDIFLTAPNAFTTNAWGANSGGYDYNQLNVTTSADFNDGAWHMLVATISVVGDVEGYLDGASVGSLASAYIPGLAYAGNYLVLGLLPGLGGYYAGSLAQVAGLPLVLTATEVANLWSLR